MLKALWRTCAFASCIVSASLPLAAQEVIHALTGTVISINNEAKTITVLQDSGSKAVFKEMSNPKTPIAFDKEVADESTAASAFNEKGAYSIVFYFGIGGNRRIVALKGLGAGPFASTEGTVTKVDRHNHSIYVRDKTGIVKMFKINKQTIAEGNFGAVEGLKFDADSGDHIRVVSKGADGNATVLFMRDLSL